MTIQKGIGEDDECVDAAFNQCRKTGREVAICCGAKHYNLLPSVADCRPHGADARLVVLVFRVDKECDLRCIRDQFA